MAENITIGINLDDGGKAEQLRKSLESAKKAASETRIPNAVQAARQGVAASQPMAASYRAAAAQPSGGASDTNLGRGVAGATGAAGRDFAAQAQGLGGLVHVYATFAANLYAVSAAFGALSKAMDTSNLVKGLDQLGASSGRTLSTLAKQMVSVSDGAISMRDAMSSTAMTTAAGMSNANILRLTAVAQKASLALGRDLPDSMDRLTKGIVKTQPELLDELGIMTRVIPAQQAYAREIGKTVDQLTTFEKQQAFANAVLAEGEAKFGNINIESNPYSKLLASMTNVATKGLDIVNTVLGPIAKVLSESPTGLALAMTAVAGVLLKQAIPAIGQYRKGLEELKNINLSKVAKLSDVIGESGVHDAEMAARAKQRFLDKNDYAKQSNEIQTRLMKEADILEEAHREASIKRGQSMLGHETTNAKIGDRAYKEASMSNIKYSVAETQSAFGMVAAFERMNIELDKAKKGEQTIDIGGGVIRKVPEINRATAAFSKLGMVIGIVGSAAFTLLEAFQPWILIITAAAVALGYLDTYLSSSTEQQEKFKSSTEGVSASIKTAAESLDFIGKKSKNIFSADSILAMTNALAGLTNALEDQLIAYNKLIARQNTYEKGWDWIKRVVGGGELNTLIESFGKSLPAAINTMILSGKSDKLRGLFADILHVDPEDTRAVEVALKSLSKPDAERALEKLQKGMRKFADEEQRTTSALTDFKNSLTEINKLSDDLTNSIKLTGEGAIGENLIKSAGSLTIALADPVKGLEAIRTIANDFKTMSLLPPQAQQQLLQAKVQADDLARSLDKAMKLRAEASEKQQKLQATGDYQDKGAGSYIGGSQGAIGGAIGGAIIGSMIAPGVGTAIGGVLGGAIGIAAGSAFGDYIAQKMGVPLGAKTTQGVNADREKRQAEDQIKLVQTRIETFTKSQTTLIDQINQEGINRISLGLKLAGEQASLTVERALIGSKSAAGLSTSKDEYNLTIKQLDIQRRLIESAYNQQIAQIDNTEKLEILNATLAKKYAQEDLKTAKPEDKAGLNKIIENSDKFLAKVSMAGKIRAGEKVSTTNIVDLKDAYSYNAKYKIPEMQKGAALEGNTAEITAAGIKLQTDLINDQRKDKEKSLEVDMIQNKSLLERIDFVQKLSGGYSENLLDIKTAALLSKEDVTLAQQKLPLETELQHLNNQKVTQEVINRKKEVNQKLESLKASSDIAKLLITINAEEEKFVQTQKNKTQEFQHQKVLQDQFDQIAVARIGLQEQQLSNALALNTISETDYANQKASLALTKESIASAAAIKAAEEDIARAKDRQAEVDKKILDNRVTLNANTDPAQRAQAVNPDFTDAKKRADYAVEEAKSKLNTVRDQSNINKLGIENIKIQEIILAKDKERDKNNARQLSTLDEYNKLLFAQIDLEQQRLDNAKALGQFNEEGYITFSNNLKVQKQAAEFEKTQLELTQQLNVAKTTQARAQAEYDKQSLAASFVAFDGNGTAPEVSSGALDAATKDTNLIQLKIDTNQNLYDIMQKQTAESKLQSLELEKQNKLTSNLKNLFGDVGGAIGDTIGATKNAIDNRKKFEIKAEADKQKELKQVRGDYDGAEEARAEIGQKYDDLSYKNQIDNMEGISTRAKKMFGEKTAAYKIFDAVEKASMITKLVLQGRALAMEWGLIAAKETGTATEIAGAAVKNTSTIGSMFLKGQEAVLSALAAPFPLGFIAGGAMAAIVASMLAGLGGGSTPSIPNGFSAADNQANQGTGTRGGANTGAFGDSGAKSTAIKDSIDNLSNIAFDQYNLAKDETLTALLSIRDNIGVLAKSLYSLKGITSGSAFGTIEGEGQGGSSFVGKLFGGLTTQDVQVLDTGIQVVGKLSELSKGLGSRSQYENTEVKTNRLFGNTVDFNAQYLDLSSSVNKTVTDIFKSFSDVLTKQSAFFGKTAEDTLKAVDVESIKVSVSAKGLKGQEFADAVMAEIGIQLDAATARAFPELIALQEQFGSFGESLSTFKDRVIKESADFTTATKLIGFNQLTTFTTKGVSDAVVNELNSAKAAQTAASKKPTDLKYGYHEMGEAAYQEMLAYNAVVYKNIEELSASNTRLAAAQKAYGEGQTSATKQQLAAEQSMYSLFKNATDEIGSDSFNKAFNDYYESYYTDAEKLSAKQATVTSALLKLKVQSGSGVAPDGTGPVNPNAIQKNLSDILKTKDDLKAFMKTLDAYSTQVGRTITGMTDQQVIKDLLDIEKAFSDVTTATTTTTKALTDLELASAKLDQQIKIYDILNQSEAALALTRQKELDAMDARLRPVQVYIYALEDEAKIRDTLSGKLKSNISNLKGFIASLTSARDQLMLGAQSVLTPQEKYNEAKAQLDALKSAIATTGTDTESIAARDAALNKLPAATTTFLDASKVMYASSEQYTKDFAEATDYLKTTADKLTLAKTDAEAQLAAVQTGNGFLEKIDLSSKSTAELMKMLVDASAKTVTAAGTAGVGAGSGAILTTTQKIVDDLYKQLFNRSAEKEGLDYWTNKLDTKALTADTLKTTLLTYLPIHNLTGAMTPAEIKAAIADGVAKDPRGTFNEINSRGYSSQQIADFLSITKDQVLAWAQANGLGSFAADTAAAITQSVDKLSTATTDVKTAADTTTAAASTAVNAVTSNVATSSQDESPWAVFQRAMKSLGDHITDVIPHAAGGIASGMSLVGEQGPELADFQRPARIYSNGDTKDLFNNKELVSEIKALREEVAKLREEQHEQTGHLIASTYDANSKASTRVAAATENATINASWKDRSAVKIS